MTGRFTSRAGGSSLTRAPRRPISLGVACALVASGAASATERPAAPRIVGSLTAASGANLYVKRASTGALARLGKGTILYVGDIIAAGPSSAATVRLLATDASLPPGDDLISVYKQLASSAPAATAVGKEFGIAADATRKYKTLKIRRSGGSVYLTLEP